MTPILQESFEKAGLITGFVSGYLLFTVMLFFVLTLSHKFPTHWSFLNLIFVTLTVTLIGLGIKKILK